MSLLIAGSIATDHLMTFGGKFADSLVVEQLDKLSVSFLVDDLEIRRGGCAGNIAFGLAQLGLRPVLVGVAGEDFADYRSWLRAPRGRLRLGPDLRGPAHGAIRVHHRRHDGPVRQLLPGAMSEARLIELEPIVRRVGDPTYVLIGPDDPEGMVRHTQECRQRGYAFVADPSQQLAFGEGEMIRELVDGAAYLFSNEYESHLIESKTGWSADEILSRVGTQVDHAGQGRRSHRQARDQEPVVVTAVPGVQAVEPTGVGDAFRSGFLAALEWGLGHERAAQVGCVLAAYVVEQVGTQEYSLHPGPVRRPGSPRRTARRRPRTCGRTCA